MTLLTMGQALAAGQMMESAVDENYAITEIQQTKSVSGRVTDATGETIPGVTIVVKGTTLGTTTDIDGEYQLTNIQENAVLVFSFVGLETQEISVAGKTVVDVVMSESSIALQEVVAVGYGTMKRSDLTGAVASVSSRDFIDMAASSSNSILAGKAPGVTIRKSSGTGCSTHHSREGANSLMGSNDPLIVVDGNYGGLLTCTRLRPLIY